jgi:hypothetical protein
MNNIRHSKYKNSGLLFELLIKQIASDTLSNNDSPSVGIIKKFFNKNTELAKELKLYQTIINSKPLSEGKAEVLINTVLEISSRINKKNIRSEKYNLIKEIKKYYNVEDFFRSKVNNYKELAAIYNLIESKEEKTLFNPSQIIQNKHTLLEHITKKSLDENSTKDAVLEEYSKLDKGSRIIAYKMLLEKFNKKYSTLSLSQKNILKEYINNDSNTSKLNEYIADQYIKIKNQLLLLNKKVDDSVTKIKINEIINLINLPNSKKVKDEDLISLLHYHQLINELKEANNGK